MTFTPAPTQAKRPSWASARDDPPADANTADAKPPPPPPRARRLEAPLLNALGLGAIFRDPDGRDDDADAAAARADETFTHKMCKMCGNVCNAKMTSCTSCCLPLTEPGSYAPATMPKPGAVASDDDATSEDDASSNEGDGDGDGAEPSSSSSPPPPSAMPSNAARAAMERRKLERRRAATEAATAEDEDDESAWWARGWRDLSPPTRARGHDPALRSAYDVLGLPLGAGEDDVRAAYRREARINHPDKGGEPEELERVHDAFDAIALDAWRHDDGARALRDALAAKKEGKRTDADATNGEDEPTRDDDSPPPPKIFVSVCVYRDPEAQFTLRDVFAKATRPERVFVGVSWRYKLPRPPSSSSAPVVIDRMHRDMAPLAYAIEREAAKIKDEEGQRKYLTECMDVQREAQAACDDVEAKRHGKAGVAALASLHDAKKLAEMAEKQKRQSPPSSSSSPALAPTSDAANEWAWASHVRETHKRWDGDDGPCYARHLADRLWGGEEYVLRVDARTRFDRGWDETLLSDIRGERRSRTTVLTGYPLGYRMRQAAVYDGDDPVTAKVAGYLPLYGRGDDDDDDGNDDDGNDVDADAPTIAAVGMQSFGERLPKPAAVRIARGATIHIPDAGVIPVPNPNFVFAPAEALIRDAPSDPHAPFLYLGEELSLGARLFTRGWDLELPRRCPLRQCYDPTFRSSALTQDRRAGRMMYGDPFEAGRGDPAMLVEREELNLQSQRRVLQLIGEPDLDSATSDPEDAVAMKGAWGVGSRRSTRAFVDRVGVDFAERTVSSAARRGGVPPAAVAVECNVDSARHDRTIAAKREDRLAFSGDGIVSPVDGLPLRWRGVAAYDDVQGARSCGPEENV